nr:integrase, catalytic region, zinc finger, CCHC-type, peptidase aspartic, catalytic [Tanacetum cinerariifolium]
MFRTSLDKIYRKAKKLPNTVSASSRTKPITVSQPSVITKKNVNSDLNGLSSTGLDSTKIEDHSLEAIQRMIGSPLRLRVKCLISVNHDECLVNYVNGKKFRGRKHKANVSKNETQKEYRPKVSKSKNVGPRESLATPKPRKPRFLLRWSPTGKMFDSAGKLVAPSGCSKHMTGNLKLLINFVWKFMITVRFGNDHVAAILGFGNAYPDFSPPLKDTDKGPRRSFKDTRRSRVGAVAIGVRA